MILFSQYLKNVGVPFVVYYRGGGGWTVTRFYLFRLFPGHVKTQSHSVDFSKSRIDVEMVNFLQTHNQGWRILDGVLDSL